MGPDGPASANEDGCRLLRLARIAGEREGTLGTRKPRPRKTLERPRSFDFPKLWGDCDVTVAQGKHVKLRCAGDDEEIGSIHPVLIGKLLEQYFPGNTELRKSRKMITLRTRDAKQFEGCVANFGSGVKITTGGGEKTILLEEMKDRNTCKGVISDIAFKQMSNEEMLQSLNEAKNNAREARQFLKRKDGGSEPTGSFVVTFDCERIPERVRVCGIVYRVRQYYPSVMTCSRCLALGHFQESCKAEKLRCRSCGGDKEDDHICGAKTCIHCAGVAGHGPTDPNCPVLEYERLVIHYKTDHRVSYRMARQAIKEILEKKTQQTAPSSFSSQLQSALGQDDNDSSTPSNVYTELQGLQSQREEREKYLADIRAERLRLEALNREIEQEVQALKKARLENLALNTVLKQTTEMEVDEDQSAENNQKRRLSDTEEQPPRKKNGTSVPLEIVSPSKANLRGAKVIEDIGVFTHLTQDQKTRTENIEEDARARNVDVIWHLRQNLLIPVEIPDIQPEI